MALVRLCRAWFRRSKGEPMFSAWKVEKAVQALVDEAQALVDRLEGAKPHVLDAYAATGRYWRAVYLADGLRLDEIGSWKTADVTRFAKATEGRIAALRKARDYEKGDVLAIWLHTARGVTEPRVKPPVLALWQLLLTAGPNADSMAAEMIAEAGLPPDAGRSIPAGFGEDGRG